MHPGWTVVIPVKPWGEAKSRMAAHHPAPALLARAFLEDVLDAVSCVPCIRRTIVATHDDEVTAVAHAHGALAIDDAGYPGINPAVAQAMDFRLPGTGVAALVSDLPWLTPDALDLALGLGSGHDVCIVPDLEGTGTTLWMAASVDGLPARFGPDSRRAHERSGAVDLVRAHPDAADDLRPARSDADTALALRESDGLLLGAHTRRLLQERPLLAEG